MEKSELIPYLESLIGVPYNKNEDISTHSVETGFNCFSFCAFVYKLVDKGDYKLTNIWTDLRDLHKHFSKINPPYQFLDIPLWNNVDEGNRHIGVMQDSIWCWQCSTGTNGVARIDTRRAVWTALLEGVYRHREI